MKRLLINVLILFNFGMLQAQITISTADLPKIGDTIVLAADTMPSGIVVGGSKGQGQHWDFSMLNEHSTSPRFYMLPSETPYSFPYSDLALKESDTSYSFFEYNNDIYKMVGRAGTVLGSEYHIIFNPYLLITNLPLNYDDQFTNNYDYTWYYTLGADSMRQKSVVSKSFYVDSYGTMTIPAGTFDVLRVSTSINQTDSTWIRNGFSWTLVSTSQSIFNTMEWHTNDSAVDLRLVICYFNVNDTSINRVEFFSNSTANIPVYPEKYEISVYPNPASDLLYLNNVHERAHVQLFDLSGKLVLDEVLEPKSNTIRISRLNPGTYTCRIQKPGSDRGFFSKKIIIN